MKYFSVSSLIDALKVEYPTLSRVGLIFNVNALRETQYKQKQGMPCLMKIFTEEGDQLLKFEDIQELFDEEDFYVAFRMPASFKDNFVCLDVEAIPINDERLDNVYYPRNIRQLGPKALKLALQEYKKQKPHIAKDLIVGEPFEI